MSGGGIEVCKKEMKVLRTIKKMVLFPPLYGKFEFDATTGIAVPDNKQQIIYSVVEEQQAEFLEKINQSGGNYKTGVINLKNGNKIVEMGKKHYHPQDYFQRSMTGMSGLSYLKKTAVNQ